jgi:hypothetical protein
MTDSSIVVRLSMATHTEVQPFIGPYGCLTNRPGPKIPASLRIILLLLLLLLFLHGLGRLTCSGVDAVPSFPGTFTISSPSRFVIDGVFRKSDVHSFKVVDPVLFVFGSHVLYFRDL